MDKELQYKRILLKLSGENFQQDAQERLSAARLSRYAEEIARLVKRGLQLAVVVGGGNFFRGHNSEKLGIDRVQGDYMGMLATVINGMALQSALEDKGLTTRLMAGLRIEQVCEPFIRRRAIRHLERGRVVIFSAGIGNPYFTTDSTASLRAIEIKAEVVLKGSKVDGVYSSDPVKNPSATRYNNLSFHEAYSKNLQVMDRTAFTLCMENHLPIIVFNANEIGNLTAIVEGQSIGTLIHESTSS